MKMGTGIDTIVEEELVYGALRREETWRKIGIGGAVFGVMGCLSAAAVALLLVAWTLTRRGVAVPREVTDHAVACVLLGCCLCLMCVGGCSQMVGKEAKMTKSTTTYHVG